MGDHELPRRTFLAATAGTAVAGCLGEAGGTVGVTLDEWSVVLSETPVPAGEVTVDVVNRGQRRHELVVFRTDVHADELPTADDGRRVDEASEELVAVGRTDDLAPGGTASLSLSLQAGPHVAICNRPDHYSKGTYVEFEVR